MTFIEWVQRRLIAHNFNPGKVDGIWGRRTRRATIAFQHSRQLSARGVLNKATVEALREAGDHVPRKDLLDFFPWMELAIKKKRDCMNDKTT